MASSRLSQAEQEGNLGDVAATLVGEAEASNNLGLLDWLATHASLENVTFTFTDDAGLERQVSAHEYLNAVAIPRVQARTYTGGDITEQNAPAAWNSNLDTITGALDTLNDPNATPEQLQQAAATLSGLGDAFEGSGFERRWDHDNDESTPDQQITAAEQLRKWAGYAGERADSIYADGDITPENAPAAWNSNLDTITGALDTLNDPNATPEQLQQAAATLSGLADAFDGSGFERSWDHDNDESTPDQQITAAEKLRKWAGYAGERADSIYADGDITPENAPAAWNSNLDTLTGALDTLNDPNATPEDLQQAAATLSGLADAFEGSGFERTWDHDNDPATPAQPITAAEKLRKWAGYAGERADSISTTNTLEQH